MAAFRSRRRGNAMIEFTLVGIPMIFVLISVFELARGMWLYHTAAYAFREGVRFAIVRGNNCGLYPNNCTVTIQEIAGKIRDAAVGLIPSDLQNINFTAYDDNGNVVGTPKHCDTLQDCLTGSVSSDYWPANAPGAGEVVGAYQYFNRIEISGEFPFRSAVAMFWPGKTRASQFPTFFFPASSREAIQY